MLDAPTRARIAAASGRAGGLTNLARNGSSAVVAPARAGFMARFIREVDPDGTLSSYERSIRARAAMKAYMATLALRSAQARARRSPS